MPIENYYWDNGGDSGLNNVAANKGSHFIDMTDSEGTQLVTDENSGRLSRYATQTMGITPIASPLGGLRNGKFAFILTGAIGSTVAFNFYVQELISPVNTVTKKAPVTRGNLSFELVGSAGGIRTVNLRAQQAGNSIFGNGELLFRKRYTSAAFDGSVGSIFQIEWITNHGDPTPLSSDPANPSLPTVTFIISASLLTPNEEDLVPVVSSTINLTEFASRTSHPDRVYTTTNAIARDFDPAIGSSFAGVIGTAFPLFGGGVAISGGFSSTVGGLVSTSVTTDRVTRPLGGLAAQVPGYVGQGDRQYGLLEPVGGEHIMGPNLQNISGWLWGYGGTQIYEGSLFTEDWET